MSILILLVAFLLVTGSTLALFWWIGIRPNSMIFSREDAQAFREAQSPAFRWFMVSSTIFTTLTSLATVYVFFLGSSKLFGIFIFAAPLSICLSSFVTVAVTRKVLDNRPDFRALLASADRTSGVVARLVWSDDPEGKRTAQLIRWISLINIASVLWLEFSVFGDLSAGLIQATGGSGDNGIVVSSLIVWLSVFCVFFLLLRYGLRGFVFADVFHSPFVLLSCLAALWGIYVIFSQGAPSETLFEPMIPDFDVWLFVAHVFALNFTFVLLTEGHWFRLWLFEEQENAKQLQGTLITGFTWAILGVAGCLAVVITPAAGTPGFIPVALALQDLSPALLMLFWIGVSAAIFSVADAQIYNFMIVKGFDAGAGLVDSSVNRPAKPLMSAIISAFVFTSVFAATRYFQIPFEKLVFILFPFCLNALPAFLPIAFGKKPRALWVWLSLAGYSGLSVYGLFRPEHSLAANLGAALVPIVASLPALITAERLKAGSAGAAS